MPPTITFELNGLVLRIFQGDHNPPHFHVIGPDVDFSVEIATFKISAGKYNRKAKKILNWAKQNRLFLQTEWDKTNG